MLLVLIASQSIRSQAIFSCWVTFYRILLIKVPRLQSGAQLLDTHWFGRWAGRVEDAWFCEETYCTHQCGPEQLYLARHRFWSVGDPWHLGQCTTPLRVNLIIIITFCLSEWLWWTGVRHSVAISEHSFFYIFLFCWGFALYLDRDEKRDIHKEFIFYLKHTAASTRFVTTMRLWKLVFCPEHNSEPLLYFVFSFSNFLRHDRSELAQER